MPSCISGKQLVLLRRFVLVYRMGKEVAKRNAVTALCISICRGAGILSGDRRCCRRSTGCCCDYAAAIICPVVDRVKNIVGATVKSVRVHFLPLIS